MRRQGLSAGRVLSVFLVVGGLSTILWMLWERTGRLIPEPPLLAGLLFLLLIAFLLGIAWPVRAFVRGTSDKALEPLRAARALVFAQAGALTGAALAGWYAAQLVMVLLGLELAAYHGRAWRLALLTLGAMLLAGAGLLAQHWCRVPPRDEPKGRERGERDS